MHQSSRKKKRKPRKVSRKYDSRDNFEVIFMGKGCEPLTENLIQELLNKEFGGLTEGELRKFAKEGYTYNRKRNSIFGPLDSYGF